MPPASVKPYVSGDERIRLGFDVRIPMLALASLIAVALFAAAIQPGPFVNRITIVNHSAYALDVEVAGARANDWTQLQTASGNAADSVQAVFDQGSTWTFRFTLQGRVLGEVVQSRAELVSAGWRVVVPDEYAVKLRSEGVAPTA
jgi:hypothetical protein